MKCTTMGLLISSWYLPSAWYSENQDSSDERTLLLTVRSLQSECLPTQVVSSNELQSGQDPGEEEEHTDGLRLGQLCMYSLVLHSNCCHSCRVGWSQMSEEARCEAS